MYGAAEPQVVDSCLVNVGDGCQKFFGENGIKLNKVQAIVLTSFAPHNVSGLPGVLLAMSSLGVGALTIVGPPGLAGLVENMGVFVNRRYPVLRLVEWGGNNQESRQIWTGAGIAGQPSELDASSSHIHITARPVRAQGSSGVFAMSASFALRRASPGLGATSSMLDEGEAPSMDRLEEARQEAQAVFAGGGQFAGGVAGLGVAE